MKMDLTPEQQLAVVVREVQADIASLQENQKELREFITGNGDPKKGLMWLAANQGELLATLGGLIAAQTKSLEEHKNSHEIAAPISTWGRLGYEAMRQVVVSAVLITMALFALGVITFTRNGGHL